MTVAVAAAAALFPILQDLEARADRFETGVPAAVAAAEAVVARMEAKPNSVIEVPRQWCWGFCEEMIGRAGGLAQIGGEINQPEDTVLFAVRSWEHFGDRASRLVADWRREGKLVVAIASAAGRPADFAPDHFIDNGAPDGSRAHAPANAIANAVAGWTFCLEYAAAWSRRGRFPAVWKSVAGDECWAVNAGIFSPDGRVRLYSCSRAIEAGSLSAVYLNRYRRRIMDLGSEPSLRHVDAAAEFIAGRLAEGKRAAFSSIGHLVLYEATQDLVSPMFGFRSNSGYRSRVFPLALGRGDVLVWIGYTSPSSRWADYLCGIRESGTDIVYSAAPSMPANPVPDGTKAIVPQHWLLPDAEVAIPAPPGAMAPLSEVDRCVVVKMIDRAVAAKLAERGVTVPKCGPRDAAAFAALDEEVGPRFPPPRAPESKKPFHGYARWHRWHDDRVLVCRDGLWGLADGDGVLLAPIRYENMRIASDHLLATQVGDKYGVVDRDGREVIAPSLQCVLPPWKWLQVKVAFMQDGKFGILDPVTGRVATPATFAKYPAGPVEPKPDAAPVDFSGWSREFMP